MKVLYYSRVYVGLYIWIMDKKIGITMFIPTGNFGAFDLRLAKGSRLRT